MHIRAPRNRQQSNNPRPNQRVNKPAVAYESPNAEFRDIHFSFEATLLFELIQKHGDIRQQLLPWYFPNAYLQNAEMALGVASKIVGQAKMAGIQLDLNFVFQEIRQLNRVGYQRDDFVVHAERLEQHLGTVLRGHADFQPGQYLANDDREILQMLHEFAVEQPAPLAQVEDFALLYAISKWEHSSDDVTMQLNGTTAKYLVQHNLHLIDPDFVPLLIAFYKKFNSRINTQLATAGQE